MKTSKLIILTLGLLVLSACGDDSSGSGSGSGGKYTGNKSDISAAKKLVHEYETNNMYFEKGTVPASKVKNNLLLAESYASFAQNQQALPSRYFAMRHVGCITSDGSLVPSEQNKHTQMDLLVGESSAKAVYVQKNKLDRCYLGQINYGGQYNISGLLMGSKSGSKGIFGLPQDKCQDLVVDKAYVQIDKEKFQYSGSNQDSNYWVNRSRWSPNEDSYYEVKDTRYSAFNGYSRAGSSEDDSFAVIASGEAVFVSAAIRSRTTNPSCVKDAYWGFDISSSEAPNVQILGRN
jgi:hypothetical protein